MRPPVELAVPAARVPGLLLPAPLRLTFESRRGSRELDGLWRRLAAEIGHDPRWMKRFMERDFRAEGRERTRARRRGQEL